MALSVAGSVSSDDQTSLANDKVCLLGENLCRTATAAYWNTSGDWTGTGNLASSTNPAILGYDDQPHLVTTHSGTSTAIYYVIDINGDQVIDYCAVLGHNVGTVGGTLKLSVADTATGPWTELEDFGALSDDTRVVDLNLDSQGAYTQATGVEFARLEFTAGSGQRFEFGEVMLGRRRQFNVNPVQGYDPNNLRSSTSDFISAGGVYTRYIRSKGQRSINAIIDPHTDTYITRMTTFFEDDIGYGSEPFLWVDNPSSAPTDAPFVRLANPELIGPGNDTFSQRVFQLSALEMGTNYVALEV